VNAASDHQLLRDYADRADEAAFREIVARHTNFVYSAALRQVESSAVAGDLAQGVFTDLARRAQPLAEKITGDRSLAGWLHRATRFAVLNHLRDDRRRRDHERQAMQQLFTDSEPSADWTQISPVLDEALDSLDDDDREIILLRYFQNQDFRAVGHALGVSDDTAQKRVSRAVEKLRDFFSKKKITVGAGSLGILISANAVQAAPVGLAVTISAAALAGTAVTTSTILAATTKTIAMTTFQKTLVTATVAVLAGAGLYEARQAAQLRDQVQTLQQQQAPLAEQVQQLQSKFTDATNRLADLLAENSRLKSNQTELLKLRGQIGVQNNQNRELSQVQDENLKLRLKVADLEGWWKNFTNAPPIKNPYMSRDDWSESGTGEPLNALKTFLAAKKQDDQNRAIEVLGGDRTNEMTTNLIRLPQSYWDKIVGIQVVDVSIHKESSGIRKALIGTIIERKSQSIGTPERFSEPTLQKIDDITQTMWRWMLIETNGEWAVEGTF
jgi:RNA polymerase sigma factor (sigma-70 family)